MIRDLAMLGFGLLIGAGIWSAIIVALARRRCSWTELERARRDYETSMRSIALH